MFIPKLVLQGMAIAGIALVAVLVATLAVPTAEVTAQSNRGGPEVTPPPGPRTPTPEEVAMARPPQASQPTRKAYRTATSADVIANLPADAFYQRVISGSATAGPLHDPRVATGRIGTPVRVRALDRGEQDGWLVPITSNGLPVAVLSVSIREDGTGHATSFRGWPYPTVPAIPEAAARTRAALPSDDVAEIELVWSIGLGRPSDILSPFWSIRRKSGEVLFLFEDGELVPAIEIRR